MSVDVKIDTELVRKRNLSQCRGLRGTTALPHWLVHRLAIERLKNNEVKTNLICMLLSCYLLPTCFNVPPLFSVDNLLCL